MQKFNTIFQRTLIFFSLVESFVEIKRNSHKKVYQQQSCEGGAVLIETRDIADFLCFYFYVFYLDGVGACYFFFPPSCMPLLKIDRVGSDSHEYTVVEIDAVALCLCGDVVRCAVCGGLHGLTGCQEHCAQ